MKLRTKLVLGENYVINGRENLWDEYCRLRKEVKELVREKKLNIWRGCRESKPRF